MLPDTSFFVDQCQDFADEFAVLSSELIDERFTSLLESCTTIEQAKEPEEIDLALESALITVEEHAHFFEDMIREFQRELLRREELVIEAFWELAENREDEEADTPELDQVIKHQSEEEEHALPAPPTVTTTSLPVTQPPAGGQRNEQAGLIDTPSQVDVDTVSLLISEAKIFLGQARKERFPLEMIRAQINKVESHVRTVTLEWYRINASAINQKQRRDAAALKNQIDDLTVYAKKLTALEKKSGTTAPPAAKKTPPHTPPKKRPTHNRSRQGSTPIQPAAQPVASRLPELEKLPVDTVPAPASRSGREFSIEYFESLEEDYFKYRSLWNHVFKTAPTPQEREQLLKLKDVIVKRREDLSRWRNSQSFFNDDPVSLKSDFSRFKFVSVDTSEAEITRKKVRKILRDLEKNPGHSQAVKGTHALNRKVFLTAGRINPRARR